MDISQKNYGFSLIEVLISLLILSVGLLGIAAMEIKALQNTQNSYWRSVATVQIAAMLERLRVNHSSAARIKECDEWNLQNQRLLPQTKGSCICNSKECQIILTWKTEEIKMQMNVP